LDLGDFRARVGAGEEQQPPRLCPRPHPIQDQARTTDGLGHDSGMRLGLQMLGATVEQRDVGKTELSGGGLLEVVPALPSLDQCEGPSGAQHGHREARKSCPGPQVGEPRELRGELREEGTGLQDQAPEDGVQRAVAGEIDPGGPAPQERSQAEQGVQLQLRVGKGKGLEALAQQGEPGVPLLRRERQDRLAC
jgi:hypothetical protein